MDFIVINTVKKYRDSLRERHRIVLTQVERRSGKTSKGAQEVRIRSHQTTRRQLLR